MVMHREDFGLTGWFGMHCTLENRAVRLLSMVAAGHVVVRLWIRTDSKVDSGRAYLKIRVHLRLGASDDSIESGRWKIRTGLSCAGQEVGMM